MSDQETINKKFGVKWFWRALVDFSLFDLKLIYVKRLFNEKGPFLTQDLASWLNSSTLVIWIDIAAQIASGRRLDVSSGIQ